MRCRRLFFPADSADMERGFLQMLEHQKTLQGMNILVLLLAIIMLFYWYSTENSKRIEKQNLNYAMDAAQQTVVHIDIEFNNALNRVSTYSYFLGQSLSDSDVTAEMLEGMEANALFDAFRYTDAQGITLAPDGRMADSKDEEYYINGMKGESGMNVILDSPLFNGPIVSFYAPGRVFSRRIPEKDDLFQLLWCSCRILPVPGGWNHYLQHYSSG